MSNMKIVVLDGDTLNPGDLSWEQLAKLGELTVHERTSYDASQEQMIVKSAQDAEVVLSNKTPLSRSIIAQLPKLKYIGVLATGYNVIDTEAAKEQGIIVTNIPGYGTDSVAQMTFALILEITNNVGLHSEAVRRGKWTEQKDWCFWEQPLMELSGKKLGLIGYGSIGQAVAKIANAFGMQVLTYTRTPSRYENQSSSNLQFVDLQQLLETSDIISLHCPLTADNQQMINEQAINSMKDGTIIINTARGQLLDEQAVANALNNGKLRAAGLDVVSVEPIKGNNPLLTAKNCYITPHIAWAPIEARQRLMDIAVDNVRQFLAGNIVNQVGK